MTAQEALELIVASLPDDFEDAGEISVLTKAAESQDKLDCIRQNMNLVEDIQAPEDIWGHNDE